MYFIFYFRLSLVSCQMKRSTSRKEAACLATLIGVVMPQTTTWSLLLTLSNGRSSSSTKTKIMLKTSRPPWCKLVLSLVWELLNRFFMRLQMIVQMRTSQLWRSSSTHHFSWLWPSFLLAETTDTQQWRNIVVRRVPSPVRYVSVQQALYCSTHCIPGKGKTFWP